MDADVIVVGAGAAGTSTAYHLARAGHRVVVVEKEDAPARHQSGRSSGVIHSGYNVKPGTLKARFCVEGNRRLRAYCREKGLTVLDGGILVVARTAHEEATLAELRRRADANGARVRMLDGDAIGDAEPHAAGTQALQAIDGASFDAEGYVNALAADARAAGAEFRFRTRVRRVQDPTAPGGKPTAGPGVRVSTNRGTLTGRALVNCAGLHSDRLARALAPDVRIVPFRGHYAELRAPRRHLVRSHVYAAPNLAFPFLGVHLSRRTDGRVLVGPGAMLALGREAYEFHQANLHDAWDTFTWPGFYRAMARGDVRALLRAEISKSLSLRRVWEEAHRLLPSLEPADLVRSYAGNRAQLVARDGTLVDDILLAETGRSVHVLNIVSPGLTCSLPFGEHIAGRARKLL